MSYLEHLESGDLVDYVVLRHSGDVINIKALKVDVTSTDALIFHTLDLKVLGFADGEWCIFRIAVPKQIWSIVEYVVLLADGCEKIVGATNVQVTNGNALIFYNNDLTVGGMNADEWRAFKIGSVASNADTD